MNESKNLISIIVCTYNRCESLKATLDSLLQQECNGSFEWELIVVDNNSKDKTKEVVENYMPKFNGKLRYIFESIQGLSHARNAGIKEAKGEIVAFTDDDVIVDKEWRQNIKDCFEKYACDAIGGRILPLYPEDTPNWIKENKGLLNGPFPLHDYGESMKPYVKGMLPFIGANMAFRRECFDENGLFRTDIGAGKATMGEDTEFFRRLEKNQCNLCYCGNALAWHKVDKKRMNYKYIAKWYIASGRYAILESPANSKTLAVYYFGVPRYLFRQIIKNLLILISRFFNQRAFLKSWIILFFNLGRILGYRRINKCLK